MSERNFQLTLTTAPQAQYAKGHMLNIQGDTAAELNVAIEEAREIQSLAPFFVGVPALGPTAEQAVAAVTQTFPGSAPVASGATEAPGASVQPSPVAQQPAPAAVTPVAVAQPPVAVAAPSSNAGPPCVACGGPTTWQSNAKGRWLKCPNWRSTPQPNTLQHTQRADGR